MEATMNGKKIAILATDGFEQAELLDPRQILSDAGAATVVISLKPGEIKGWNGEDWGRSVRVEKTLTNTSPEEYDALLLPGGVMNPDKLRQEPSAVEFVKAFVRAGKPIGAICHGPWLLMEAGAVEGRRVTSWPSLKTDLINAGGRWEDSEVVVDRGIVTSRKPADIPAFARKLMEEISEGIHVGQSQAGVVSVL